jgi:hypothetical protein
LFEEAGEHLQPLEPTCARKLVEGAVAYAANLGFAPAPGYKAACRVFGGVKADQCPTAFVFGNKGKPCFIRGPRDTPEKCRLILNLLHTRCGEGNYEFVLSDADVDQVFGNWT